MKSPLRYQATEYDCGPTSMTNAIIYMFERNEIRISSDISARVRSTVLTRTDMPDDMGPAARRSDILARG